MKLLGQHSNNRVGNVIQHDLPADDAWVFTEAASPGPIRNEDGVWAAGLVLAWIEIAPQHGSYPKSPEEAVLTRAPCTGSVPSLVRTR